MQLIGFPQSTCASIIIVLHNYYFLLKHTKFHGSGINISRHMAWYRSAHMLIPPDTIITHNKPISMLVCPSTHPSVLCYPAQPLYPSAQIVFHAALHRLQSDTDTNPEFSQIFLRLTIFSQQHNTSVT